MLDDLFARPRRREVREIPIAPVLDMLMAVIFFLLLSTSFIEYSTQLVPGVARSPQAAEEAKIAPLSPTLRTSRTNSGELALVLSWGGESPASKPATLADLKERLVEFKKSFPAEKTLQLSFTPGLDFQNVITVMDVARAVIENIALLPYENPSGVQ